MRFYKYEFQDTNLDEDAKIINDNAEKIKNLFDKFSEDKEKKYEQILDKVKEINSLQIKNKDSKKVDDEINAMEWIKENILKTKECPHFNMIYGYLETKGKSLEDYNNGVKNKFDIKKNIKIVFTEGPEYCLKKWSVASYEDNGVVKVAIKHGVFDKFIWKNILFQIIMLLVTLYNNRKLQFNITCDNLFVKNIKRGGYWVYNIGGESLSFYLPNLGFLVMANSNFNEDKENMEITNDDQNSWENSSIDILQGLIEDFDSIPEELKDELKTIKKIFETRTNTNVVKDLIEKSKIIIRSFLNNRIGDSLNFKESDESNYVDKSDIFKIGELAVMIKPDTTKQFVLYMGQDESTRNNKIIEKKDGEITNTINELKKYKQNIIRQKYNKKINYDKKYLLDTYKIKYIEDDELDFEGGKDYIIEEDDGETKEEDDGMDGGNSDEIVLNDKDSDEILDL